MENGEDKKDEPEMFGSLKDLPGGENDNKGKALIAGIVSAFIAWILIYSAGVSGGIVGAIPAASVCSFIKEWQAVNYEQQINN